MFDQVTLKFCGFLVVLRNSKMVMVHFKTSFIT